MNSQNYQLYAPLRIKQQMLPLLKKAGFDSSLRGVVMALKPVQAEQVRRPERKQNGLCHTVGLFCLYA